MVERVLEMNVTPSPQMSSNKWKEPPVYPSIASIREDKKKLTQYIAALRLWVRVSGVEQQNQADMIQYHAFQNSPEYFAELNSKFEDCLQTKKTE